MDDSQLIALYKKSMSKNDLKALNIAESHLNSSFDIVKSIGFITFKQKLSS